jgi:polyhydroxyalkanoate synthesis regulator protein
MEEIVKYKNRKMYSRGQGKYVTLSHIKSQLQDGKAVKVTDHLGNDITATILKKVVGLTETSVNQLTTLITGN